MYKRSQYNHIKEAIENDKNISPYLSMFLIGWLHIYFNNAGESRYSPRKWLEGHDVGHIKELIENDTSHTFEVPD